PNVCGGQQCCSGWAVAPGTNRCIKPDCQPPCQNRGSCSRPHTCVCRSGFQGPRCEEVAPEQVYIRDRGALRRVQPGTNPFHRDQPQRRPSDRQASDSTRSQTPRPATSKQPTHSTTQVRRGPPDSSPQQTGTSRTVKRYPSSNGPITSNALPNTYPYSNNWNGHNRVYRPPANSPTHGQHNNAVLPTGANLTSSLDRIKIIFTPMLCRRVCSSGRCYNSCEKGDTTTVYSENPQPQQPQQTKNQGFRLFFCQIPCQNGGRCIGRDHCWCPSNSTGKFCHLPSPPPPPPPRPSPSSTKDTSQHGPSHSMYTLPLSNQQASLHPSIVNVHIQHPPEAEVQVHQVARVQPGQRAPIAEGAHSVQQRSQPGNGHDATNEHTDRPQHNNDHTPHRPHPHPSGVGRCFQETVDGQCGKPLPGLTKQDDCCGSVGASWGLNKCQKCPAKPAYAVIANGQVECSKGYKRLNLTHCQDINECMLPGICKNAECLNTKGSYRCTCKPGFMLDPARSHCISDKAVSDQRGMCYRSLSTGTCSLPLSLHITKQICCCSRVGKAWGHACERCPLPGSDHFKEICPVGHGYTYSRSDVQISLRQLDDDELQNTGLSWEEESPTYPQIPSSFDPSLPTLYPSHPHTPHRPQHPGYPETPHVPQQPATPHLPYPPFVDNTPKETDGESYSTSNPAVVTESPLKYPDVDKCATTPNICGHGRCIPVQTGYTCDCNPGFKLSALQTNCIDVNECDEDPCEGKGRCINSFGSYTCHCYSGYSQVITQNRKYCQDINECNVPNKCQNGKCVNSEGSYTCECNTGYAKSWRGHCEADVDECRDSSSCPHGLYVNTVGSFLCQACGPGFRPLHDRCVDVNECLNQTACSNGRCVNTEGSYRCNCFLGYKLSSDNTCQDVDECVRPGVCLYGRCSNLDGSYKCSCNHGYKVTSDGKACEDINECAAGNACPAGICLNTVGSFTCQKCRPGFGPSVGGLRCEDVDECAQGDVCQGGICANTEGSYTCTRCKAGYRVSSDRKRCEDIDECQSLSTCANGICLNTEGSYTCENCPSGYTVSYDGELCEDIDECRLPLTCPQGTCTNTDGSFTCLQCQPGFRVSDDGLQCDDVDECLVGNVCPGQQCLNTPGGYTCRSCGVGLQLSSDGYTCEDINECLTPGVCPMGVCTNTEGSFSCMTCDSGYTVALNGISCEDVDECIKDVCMRGQCLNTVGSYLCLCKAGFKFNSETADCEDQNECTDFGSSPCGTWRCENTIGSYRCFQTCQPDIDECLNETICGNSGVCENTDGSFHCQCDRGYTNPPGDMTRCVDVNECEMSEALCGEALCENHDGSFLCFCPNANEEFDPKSSQCRPVDDMVVTPAAPLPPSVSASEERKECYYNLNDANFCDNVLSRNVTKQECCCTVGAGWGDNCEIHACPVLGRDDYNQLCPHGNGLLSVPASNLQALGDQRSYIDANECEMFGPDICKNGQCSNLFSSYTCYCRSGFYYDNIRLECVDYDECELGNACVDGVCVNTAGSFNCFCSPPLVLDNTRRRCISLNTTEIAEPDHDVHMDICWQRLEGDNVCSEPLQGQRTTYTECCCLHGVAWSGQCAFCPRKDSEDYAIMCNLPRRGGSDSLRERPGYEYGVDGPDDDTEPFIPPYWDNYGNLPGTFEVPDSVPLFNDNDYSARQPPVRVPVHRPREQPPRPVDFT
ncbi:hypothetical protein NL108_012557, partial [Boleophthalmus pectinirostris]